MLYPSIFSTPPRTSAYSAVVFSQFSPSIRTAKLKLHLPRQWSFVMHEDALSLLPKTDFSRRGFVVTTLASGFALAVQPVSAETITTDTSGLEAGEVKIPTSDGQM